ncbi:hypothetical protein FLACOL_01066 [Flavobacterium columnare]|uniref:DUF6046 domain-containing protein n=2 Tax=Flavobacterium TaxID=237 RepID=A0ABW8PLA6_9FLAO|nr:DUF6046 domain-containing protein [Flavobacterium columnare]SPE77076.1 hypothetical protein FLACOL_01066 [Flavobacterium columnare]
MEFDFKEMTARALIDYVGPPFPLWWAKNGHKFNAPGLHLINALKLGKPYFLQLKLSHEGTEYQLPNEPLISFSLTKTIVKTATVGKRRKGTVKEYITTEDYTITIRGLCVNEDDPEEYPAEQVAMLKELVDIDDALDVVDNPFFELFGIRRIVIEDINFDEMMGRPGQQAYSIKAISDQDFYADLNDRDNQKANLLS